MSEFAARTSGLPGRRLRGLWAAYSLLGLATTALLFGFADLPITDLPQFAAQLSIWVHYDDPAFGFAERFEIHWFTPYLSAFLLARPFVGLLGVVGAAKVVVCVGVLAMPLALWRLLRVVGRDPWLSLLGFPLALCFNFYVGFINFVLSTPLIFLLLALALQFVERPGRGRALGIVGMTCGLFYCHGLAFAFGVTLTAAVILVGRPSWKERFIAWGLLVPSALLAIAWSPQLGAVADVVADPDKWQLGIHRLMDLPGSWLGMGARDTTATAVGLLLLTIVLLAGIRPSRRAVRWVPLLLAFALYLFFPMKLRGVALIAPRFAVFILPFLLVALDSNRAKRANWALGLWRSVAVLVATAWLVVLAVRFDGFNAEAKGFHVVTADIPRGQRLRPLMYDIRSKHVPGGFPFLHFAAYNQVTRGGTIGYSFAVFPMAFARYKPGKSILVRVHKPEFSYAREEGDFDYFLVRSFMDLKDEIFREASEPIVEVARSGFWYLYAPLSVIERKASQQGPVAGGSSGRVQ